MQRFSVKAANLSNKIRDAYGWLRKSNPEETYTFKRFVLRQAQNPIYIK